MRTNLADEVYRILRDRIFIGNLQPGTKVRPEALAQELGVSRTPVVEAINRLAQEELVLLQPGRGTFISELSTDRLLAHFDVRLMMEEYAAPIAVARITERDLEQLEQFLADENRLIQENVVSDHLAWHRINRDFHEYCVDIAGNILLSEFYARLNVDIVLARAYKLALLRFPEEVHSEHIAIFNGYVAKDSNALLHAIRAHLSLSRAASVRLAMNYDSI